MQNIQDIVVKRLQTAEKELAELEENRRILLRLISEFRTLLGECNGQAEQVLRPASVNTTDKTYAKMTAAQTMQAALRAAGKPLRIGELAAAAIAGGYKGIKNDPKSVVPNFSSQLSRMIKASDSPIVRGKIASTYELREWEHSNGEEATNT